MLLVLLFGCNHPTSATIDAAADATPIDAVPFTPAPHMAWPVIPNHGGHELISLRVVTVIAADEPYAADLQAFGDAIVHSTSLATFGPEYGLLTTGTHRLVTGPHVAPGTSFTQQQMNTYIRNAVAAATPSPTPDGRTVYVLYLPPGTVMDDAGTPDTACALVPYHTGYGTLGDGMAVLNRCPQGFTSQLEMFEIVAAHEIAEAATDSNPVRDPAWELWVDTGTPVRQASLWNQVEVVSELEIGDMCIGTRSREGAFEYQREFSNAAATTGGDPCVPALAVPYFNVSPNGASTGWFPAAAGAQVTLPLTGWATAATADWIVTIEPVAFDGARFAAHVTSETTQTIGSRVYRTTNNGRELLLTATIPATATSGWWGVVKLWSWHADASGQTPVDEDIAHEGLVGLYVP